MGRSVRALALVLVVASIAAVRIELLSIPFERDEGDYFYLAQRVLDGGTPYVSYYEQKLPGLFYSYALIVLLFGPTVEGAHVAFLIINVLTILLLYAAATMLFDGYAPVVAAATFAVLSLGPAVSGFTTQSEHLVALFATTGTLLLLRAEAPRRRWLFLSSGIAFGAAFLVKTNGLFFVAFGSAVILALRLLQRPVPWRALVGDAAAYFTGVGAICLGSLVPVVAHGALREMWYWTWIFPRYYVSSIRLSLGVRFFADALASVTNDSTSFWVAAVAGPVLIWFVPTNTNTRVVVVLLAGFSLFTIVPGLRFYGHYWIQLLPATALAMAAAFHSAGVLLGRWVRRSTVGVMLATVYLGALGANAWAERAYYIHPDNTRVLRECYHMNPFPEAMVVGTFLREHTTRDDRIVVLGSEPEIYFYADRRAPTRHHYLAFLMGDKAKLPRSSELQQEFIRDVSAARPRYMVLVWDSLSWDSHPNADRSILTWFHGFAAQGYRLAGLVDLIAPDETQYRWYADVASYRVKGQSQMVIYERLPDRAPRAP